MPSPVTKTYYCNTSSFDATTFGGLSDGVAPPQTNTIWGWNTGRNNPPLYCEMNWNVAVSRLSTQWEASPTSSSPTQNAGGNGEGNCWIYGPISGEFTSGNWIITMSVKSVNAAAAHTGQFIYRFWKASNEFGSGSALITSSFYSSSIASLPSNTTTTVSATSSIALNDIIFRNEYLFLQTYWSLLTNPGGGAGNNAVDNDYVLGATASLIISPSFIADSPQFIQWIYDGDD